MMLPASFATPFAPASSPRRNKQFYESTPFMNSHRLAQVKSIARADHEIILFGIGNFRRLFVGAHSADAPEDFVGVQRLLQEKIVRHFTYEEDNLFPALLDANPTAIATQTIAELRQEHMRLVERSRQLSALVGQRDLTNCTGQIWTAMMDFFNDLEKHAAKEDALLESCI